MEIRDYARTLIETATLAAKLAPPPPGLSDERPGPALFIERPGRPPQLAHDPRRRVRVPPPEGLADPAQRLRVLHALANHELQAVELFAWALLAFPEAPRAFRRGCLAILREEQRHLTLYLDRLEALGGRFGDHPVTAHFWAKVPALHTPLHFVCALGLTFENANLDFAAEHAAAARRAGDEATARLLETVHRDEIRHVRFAWRWLERLKPRGSRAWETYRRHVAPPHGPERARGATFDAGARRRAGLDPEFIDHLARTRPTRPGGAPR